MERGNDSDSGLEKELAWRTFNRINSLLLAPGDRVKIVSPGSTLYRDNTSAKEAKGEDGDSPVLVVAPMSEQ